MGECTGRIDNSARRLDSLNRGVEQLQLMATEYRDRVARNQAQLDSNSNVACSTAQRIERRGPSLGR